VLGTSRPPLWLGIVVAGALLIVEASVVDLLTHTAAHGTFGLVFLLGLLVISAGWGMGLAVVTLASAAVYAYFHVGYFHVGASGGLLRADVAEVVAIAIFLLIAAFAAGLVGQVRSRALEAEERGHDQPGRRTRQRTGPAAGIAATGRHLGSAGGTSG